MTMASQFANIMSSSNIFDGGFVSLVKFTGLVTLTVIFSFIRANQKSGNRKTYVWVLPNIWRVEKVSDTKFGANGSKNPKKGLLNAGKCQGYSFYRFWVIMGKPIKWGVGGGNITPSPTQIRVNRALLIFILLFLFFRMVSRQIGKLINIMKDK